jgi:hypothetical protein
MVVLVTLMGMLGAVMVAVIMMVVIMAAAAIGAMGVRVVMLVLRRGRSLMSVLMVVAVVMMLVGLVSVPMIMMVVMAMIVAAATGIAMCVMLMPVMVMIVVVAVIIGAALGLERPLDLAHGAALAADHFGEHMVVLDIDRVGGDLGGRVAVADMPGDAHQPQRVLGANLQQALRRRLDQNEPAILQLDGIAIVQRGRLVEIEQDVEPAIALERDAAAIAVLMVERQRLDDLVLLDRGLASDGGGAQHDREPVLDDQRRSTDRGSITSTTAGSVTQAPATLRKAL